MACVLLVVFDGLRPDMINPEVTPNLVRFAAMGARLPRARSAFPSETRVCTASVATGCHPRRHGLVANQMRHPGDPTRLVDTGQARELREMEQHIGGPAIERPGLSDLLAAAGRDFAVFSSGSTGQTFVLAPRADALGQIVVNGHGPEACSAAGREVMARLDAPPQPALARAVWVADAWRTTMLPAPPAASVLWLCEPDTSAHYEGLDSPGQQSALRAVDAAFGRILDDWQAGPARDRLQIIVASDHGHVLVNKLFDVGPQLANSGLFAGCAFSGGGVSVPGADWDRIGLIGDFLMRQEWIAQVFTCELVEAPHGALPHAAVMADHARAAHVLYTLHNGTAAGAGGMPGTTWLDSAEGLRIGSGTHGGLNPSEMATVLMLAGSKVRPAIVSSLPAGLIDIAPTILHLLDVPGGSAMDGRVLVETLESAPAPTDSHSVESWEASSDVFGQRVARARMGRHVWIDHGARMGQFAPI